MFSKILIANRGEIAVRVIRACKEMGIATVAVYSQADRDALHVQLADESVCVGPAAPSESYLAQERVLSAALITGAQAIHPGYGFLSENAHFARLCRKNGVVFIGPEADRMERLEDKAGLKALLRSTPLRPIPGTEALSSLEEALVSAEGIGYPVMLKACCGGGGRGIRVVASPEELRSILRTRPFDETFFTVRVRTAVASSVHSSVFADPPMPTLRGPVYEAVPLPVVSSHSAFDASDALAPFASRRRPPDADTPYHATVPEANDSKYS